MESAKQIHHVKLDSSGRLLIPSEMRERHHIATGDTLVVADDEFGLRIKTREQLLAEVQAHFAKYVPRDVSLSDEVNQDRRTEIERD
jgi:bifunctional DNA-binding transcriptional regulator/antitoxin component of YhaV-PrlF toxin-antitoxin module